MKRLIQISAKQCQAGFTIIELMIATMAFSVILLAITIGVLHFSNAYYKGVNSSATQNTARSIIDTLAQAIEFSGGSFTVASHPNTTMGGHTFNIQTYCIGNRQFDYVLGQELGKDVPLPPNGYALYETDLGSTANCNSSIPPVSGGQELLSPNMRLAKLTISPLAGGLYTIDVRVVYGDSDLLSRPHGSAANCTLQTGSQFCAVSELITTVQSRVNSGS